MPTVLVEVCDAVAAYGSRTVLRDFNIRLERGEVVGLLGHNGAGKTTAIRLCNGLLAPKSGTVRVFELDPTVAGASVRARVGVVLEDSGVDGRQTARSHLEFFSKVYHLAPGESGRRIDELLELFGLADRADEQVAGFSRGMRQRLALCRALLPEPDILYLDEPTAGLDPVAAIQLRDVLTNLRQRGVGIMLASHDLSEVSQLCDRVVILREGRIVAEGGPGQLAARWSRNISVEFEVAAGAAGQAGRVINQVAKATEVTLSGADRLTCVVESRDVIPELIKRLVGSDIAVFSVGPEIPSLETVYLSLHGDGAQ